MLGFNDLIADRAVAQYIKDVEKAIDLLLANGTVPILSTLPPCRGKAERVEEYNAALRGLAEEKQIPLIDLHAEMKARAGEETEKLYLGEDGVHLTYQPPDGPASEENLRRCGYLLRCYLAVHKGMEVKAKVFDATEPLPQPPEGRVIRVSTVAQLLRAAESVAPGGTILVADGHYMMPRYFELRTDRVTLRGVSGDRKRVILDGTESRHNELVGITACSGVIIADLTIQNAKWNGIKINSETNVQNVTIHNCVIRNIWQRGIKGTVVPARDRDAIRPRDCRVQYCLFYNLRPKQFSDDPTDTPQTFGGDYIGGIDVMCAQEWVIRDNMFVGIHGRTHQGRGAIFLWVDTRDCIVERNLIIDCDAGICLGNSFRGANTNVHCTRCIVRNNFVTRTPEAGIFAAYTRDCRIIHNTIHDPTSRLRRLIRLVHDNNGLVVANNLLSGPDVRNESPSRIRFLGNVSKDLTSSLTDPARGNLHLKASVAEVTGRAVPLHDVKDDIDGRPRGPMPDIGADQFEGRGRSR
jgi:hypothetical protein